MMLYTLDFIDVKEKSQGKNRQRIQKNRTRTEAMDRKTKDGKKLAAVAILIILSVNMGITVMEALPDALAKTAEIAAPAKEKVTLRIKIDE